MKSPAAPPCRPASATTPPAALHLSAGGGGVPGTRGSPGAGPRHPALQWRERAGVDCAPLHAPACCGCRTARTICASEVCPCPCLPLHQPLGRPVPASSYSYPALPPPALPQEPLKYEVLAFLRGEGPRPRRTAQAIMELFAKVRLERGDLLRAMLLALLPCWQPCRAGLPQQSRHPARNAEPVEAPGSGVRERVSCPPSLPACVSCRMRWWRRWSTWRLARRV